MTNTCGACKFWQEAWPADGEDPAGGDCQFPKDRLPLSMSGFAMCEQETMYSNTANCPTWTAPGGEDIPVVEEKSDGSQISQRCEAQRSGPRWLPVGTVVSGTQMLADQFKAVLEFAEEHNALLPLFSATKARAHWDLDFDPESGESFDAFHDLCDELCRVCPPFCFFGSHPGNSSDIGVWPDDEAIEEAIQEMKMVRIDNWLDVDNVSPTYEYTLVDGGGRQELYQRVKGVKSLVWKL